MMSKAIAKPNTEAGDLDSIYQDIAHRFGDDWRLAKVFAMKESSENPNAENPRDPSYGLFGIQSLWLVHFRFLDNDDPVRGQAVADERLHTADRVMGQVPAEDDGRELV